MKIVWLVYIFFPPKKIIISGKSDLGLTMLMDD